VSVEETKAVMRRYYEEAWNGRDLAVLDTLLSPDYVNHSPFVPELPVGPEGVPMVMQALWHAFPDLTFTIEDVVAEDDRVATRTVLRGTNTGDFMGAPPTGRAVEVGMVSFERVAGGRIVDHWRISDDATMLRQLGLA
jgi:steroid delta-isomerase-like uncharacterized protein